MSSGRGVLLLAGAIVAVPPGAWAQTPDAVSAAPQVRPAHPASPPGSIRKPAMPLPFAEKPDPAKAPPAAAASGHGAAEPDLAYGAYQEGHFLTAFALATRRVNDKGDPKAMTLLGWLYANGEGVRKDDERALSWYKLAAERGDREAMFELAMFRLRGRGGPRDRDAAVVLLQRAASLGHIAASYNLALLYLGGQELSRDFAKAAALLRPAADAGSPEAQYALATLYKEGRGVPQDVAEAAKLLGAAAEAGNLDAMVEFAIALFNGAGIAKDEARAAEIFAKAARRGSPIAQNRLARILSAGRGLPPDPVAAAKWHIISKAGGESDPSLDVFVERLPPAQRQAAEQAAKVFIAHLPTPRT
ncbi:MAG TPA: tetratricopeptide repeat protein [Xanthobacteraceae bacterium]|nr:tetratricopeptide repeat protein [Xanthobacteraceae bacterium]